MAGALSLFSERADCLFIFPYCLSQKNLDMMPYPLTKCVFRKPISDDVFEMILIETLHFQEQFPCGPRWKCCSHNTLCSEQMSLPEASGL